MKIEIINHKINKFFIITQISTKPYIMSYHYQMAILYKVVHLAYSIYWHLVPRVKNIQVANKATPGQNTNIHQVGFDLSPPSLSVMFSSTNSSFLFLEPEVAFQVFKRGLLLASRVCTCDVNYKLFNIYKF